MKKIALSLLLLLFFYSCSGIKKANNLINSGNYDDAINTAVAKLHHTKEKKNQEYYYLIEEAFSKAKERDNNEIDFLKKEANLNKIERLYAIYLQMNARQEKIKSLLPMKLINEGRNANFSFENYTNEILLAQNKLADFLYNSSKKTMQSVNKLDFRRAFDDLAYLNNISPNYKDVIKLMDEARFKGTDFVLVDTKNQTNMVIPNRLQDYLLDFNTYGLDDKWTVFNKGKQKGIDYEFGLTLSFVEINISPEQIKEREFVKERLIKDGKKKLIDDYGKEVIDDKGNAVLVDNMRNASIRIYETRQFKSSQILAKVDFVNLKSNQIIQSFPVSTEFFFENIYANFKGDRQAADDSYIFFDRKIVPFPNNEQMIYDTGESLKQKIKDILIRNKFRN